MNSNERQSWDEIRRALADVEARVDRWEVAVTLLRCWPVLAVGVALGAFVSGSVGPTWLGLAGGCGLAVLGVAGLFKLARVLGTGSRLRPANPPKRRVL
jgi:fatty acid desaturase